MAKDLFHDIVKIALEREGWTVTHDFYTLDLETNALYPSNLVIDLAAEKLIAAQKDSQKIAVEIKTLSGASLIYEMHGLLGQFISYQVGLKLQEPDRVLFAAIPEKAYLKLAVYPFFQMLVAKIELKLIIYDTDNQLITEWIE